ncbi:MAG: outer membrane lipoprotein-sorting protein [Thermoanaerobaculia bacterium]
MTKETQHRRFDAFALGLADRVMRRPWLAIALTLVMVLAAASGARLLEFSNNYRVFFSEKNPDLVAFEVFQATYTKNDNIVFVVHPEDGEVFNGEITEAVETLTTEAWQIPYAIRVDSITNFQHTWSREDDLIVEDLVRDGRNLTASELTEKERIALAEPLLRGNLISLDASTTGVAVTLQYPEESLTEVPEAVAVARELASRIEADYEGVEVALSGLSMLNNAFAESGQQDAGTLMPLMFLILVAFMVISLRSAAGTAATLIVVGFSAATALGLAGYLGIQLTPISVTAPVIIMTLAIADSIHILVSMLTFMREGMAKREALRESLRINFLAVAITTVTTIVGFLALNFSDSPPFHDLGNITAIGIAMAFVYSVIVLPALITVMPFKVSAMAMGQSGWLQLRLESLGDWVTRRHRVVLPTMAAIVIGLIALVPMVDLNDEWVKYFDHRVEFRTDAEFAIDHLGGLYLVEFSVPALEPEGVSEPEYLSRLESFTGWLRDQPEVTHVYSYADIIKRLNKNLHSDDEAFYRIPDNRQLAAQYLLLYELSLPFGLDLNNRINVDKSATRVTATIGDLSTRETRDFLERAEGWLAGNTPEYMHETPTGASVMFSHISDRNIKSMLKGNVLAVLLIAGVMVFALRSWKLGALSLIPNAVPILMTFGIWALLVGKVGMAAATVSASSLGIIVDDTVHFLAKYLRARREQGLDAAGAVRYAFKTVGVAIVTTSVILTAGFLVLAMSTFRINFELGLLTAIAIVIALVTDFLLLPSLLLWGRGSRVGQTKEVFMSGYRRLQQVAPARSTSSWLVWLVVAGVVLAAAAALVVAGPAGANSLEAKGFEVAARADRSDRGFGHSVVDVEMVLRNKAGKEARRGLSIRTLEVPDESVGDKSLIVFSSPADIDGTGLLSHAKILDPDDQWLYLPALKRVKRISSVNKSGPFVGSEFAFEDFTALELEKFDYSYVGEEPCGGLTCDVVERYPRYEHSGYTKQVSWVDQDVFQIRKVEFYDRKGELLKTLELTDYRLYDEAWWRSQKMSMVNHQTGKSTDFHYGEFDFSDSATEDDFTKGVLERLR